MDAVLYTSYLKSVRMTTCKHHTLYVVIPICITLVQCVSTRCTVTALTQERCMLFAISNYITDVGF